MRRREQAVDRSAGMPVRLRHYAPADWPNPECHPECAFWAAVEDWYANHPPDEDAPLEIIDGPDAPFHPEWI